VRFSASWRPAQGRLRLPAVRLSPPATFAALGVVAAAVYLANISPIADLAAFTAAAVGSTVALVVGPRRHGAGPAVTWWLLAAACVAFMVGAIARPWAATQDGPAILTADLFTLPGYLVMFLGLGILLRARGGIQRYALTDGMIVVLGAALTSALLLAMPAAAIPNRPVAVSILAALYPLLDVGVVLLLVGLAFTTVVWRPSYILLVTMILLLLVGDVAYAVIGVSGQLTGSRLLDLPFLLAYTAIGAAALHPSVVDLGRAAPSPVQAWSWPRLTLIGCALAVPYVLAAVTPERSVGAQVLLGAGGAAMVALMLMRAVSAVRGYAAAQKRFKHLATHDPLTELPNRLALVTEVDRLLDTPRPPGGRDAWIFFLDLDGFKLVNDSWGHEAGDQLIKEVARRLRATVPPDAMVARVGGDEFLVLFVGVRHEAIELVERVMKSLGAPLQVHGAEAVISASVGIASAAADSATPVTSKSLMRDADTAMYQAKAEGRGKWVVFDASMHERVRERVEIELALHQAMAQCQLHLDYQPIVELTTGRLLGAEALIRWNHPTRGIIPPNDFIPIAEDVGLISAIGRWVLHEALGQLAAWRAQGTVTRDFWISINVSPRQLHDATLVTSIADMLRRYEVPATVVVLEITESVMVDPSGATEQVLLDLRSLGVRIVVDDFGTGFSALGYLRRHPVTGVKIDRGFVAGLGSNAEDEEIVRAVFAMSTALGLNVVAEGVEVPIQRGVLATLGVVMGQGMLWGNAVSPAEFIARWSLPDGDQSDGDQSDGNS